MYIQECMFIITKENIFQLNISSLGNTQNGKNFLINSCISESIYLQKVHRRPQELQSFTATFLNTCYVQSQQYSTCYEHTVSIRFGH